MKVKVCFEVDWADEDGSPLPALGVCLVIGECASPVDYAALTNRIDKGALLRVCSLDGIAKPEDMTFITPEEFFLEYESDEDQEV